MNDATLGELRELVARSRELRDAGDLAPLATLLGQFDVALFALVTNERIAALIDNLRAHLTRIGKLTEDIPGRVEASVEEHAAIVEAIAARDPDEADRLMRVHIQSVLGDQLATSEAPAPDAEASGGKVEVGDDGSNSGGCADLARAGGWLVEAAVTHPMVRAIADGTLPHETFRRYFTQNVLYLQAYAQAIALIVAKAPDRGRWPC